MEHRGKSVDKVGSTVLHIAVLSGDVNLVQFALGQGIDIECSDGSDRPALHYAAGGADSSDKSSEICEFLLERGAKVIRQSGQTGHTPITCLLSAANSVMVKIDSRTIASVVETLPVLVDYGAKVDGKFKCDNILALGTRGEVDEVFREVLMRHMAKMNALQSIGDNACLSNMLAGA